MSTAEKLAATEWAAGVPPDQQGPAVLAMMRGEGDPTSADSWGPLRLADRPAAEPFPLEVLPPAACRLAVEGAKSIGCPVDFVAGAVLGVAGGAIGRSASLLVKPGHFASASLFVAIIGPPTSGKSPALDLAAGPIHAIDADLARAYEADDLRWKAECKAMGPKAKESELPPRPRPRRIDVDNFKLEKLPILLRDNPRGLLGIKDELSSLMGSFGEHKGGRGTDKEGLLTAWSGKKIIKDRVGDDNGVPVRSPHPCLSIVGGTTPGNLPKFVDPNSPDDGFIERFLFVYPEPMGIPEVEDEDGVSDAAADDWRALVGRLWARPMNGEVSFVARMTPEAKAARKRLRRGHAREMNDPGFNPSLASTWGKLSAYADRLALVLGLMDHAGDPTADPFDVPDVAERHVLDAWRLAAYFKSHARRAHGDVSLDLPGAEGKAVDAIVRWVKSKGIRTFSERDVKQARDWIKQDALDAALLHLAKMNAIRPAKAPSDGSKGGRPKGPVFDVNPVLLPAPTP
ncbi:DUF3987 domain-containing protein [Paludisphaera rhizosphaerae]|uniref:DUF3987 domain-containing protein n=1 Tax=Paludisphaera rhizosphaerae TaxID=2711216 RepID=UPI0013ED82DC|nr:DUF3987 domain-containing protein [Paludisphaera rhizosphaerae]